MDTVDRTVLHTLDKRLASQPWPVTIYSDANDEDDDSGRRMGEKNKWKCDCERSCAYASRNSTKCKAIRGTGTGRTPARLMETGMCRGPNTDNDIDMVLCIFLKKRRLFDRHVTRSHCLSISLSQESRIPRRNGRSRSKGRHSELKCQCRGAQACKTAGFRSPQELCRAGLEIHCSLPSKKTQSSCFFFFFVAESAGTLLPGGEMRGGSCGC